MVIKLFRLLYSQVVDSSTEEEVLMDPSLLKPIDHSLPTHQQLSTGAQVAYYDNDEEKWVDGTIKVCCAVHVTTELIH